MAGCIYCVDNDILKKLVTFDLFDSTLEIFGIATPDIRILKTAQYVFLRQYKRFQNNESPRKSDTVIKWEELLELTKTLGSIVPADIDQNLLNQLSKFEDIDPGEAELVCLAIAIIQKDESATIFTGDKRFIRALDKVDLTIIHEALKGRIWCLEQVILKNIDHLNFETVRDQIVPVRECDKAIKVVFGSGNQAEKEAVITTLKNYINELNTPLIFPYSSSSSNP